MPTLHSRKTAIGNKFAKQKNMAVEIDSFTVGTMWLTGNTVFNQLFNDSHLGSSRLAS